MSIQHSNHTYGEPAPPGLGALQTGSPRRLPFPPFQASGDTYIYIYIYIHTYCIHYIYIYIYTSLSLYLSLSLYIYIYIYMGSQHTLSTARSAASAHRSDKYTCT